MAEDWELGARGWGLGHEGFPGSWGLRQEDGPERG